ncbi:MAG: endolytic transglycosylase MltG [Alphaproteobacteria bacterium]|nr:endolytic transglycosylase MltG [Alphaproteobacteria bacterium]
MRAAFLSLLSIFLLFCAGIAVTAGVSVNQYLSAGPLGQSHIVLIQRGKGVSEIADTLEKENVISSSLLFKVAGRFGNSLKAGEYQFPPQISMAEVLRMMQEGEVYGRKFTIPEGYTSYQIVELLKKHPDLGGDISAIPKEGSLLPDTYHFVAGEAREDKIKQMQVAMKRVIDQLWLERAQDLPLKDKKEAIILASIVEKETGVAGERAKVAGVFINRLKRGIPLQTDPTVIYALTKGKIQNEGKGPLGRRLLRKDLEVDSPYNTYKNAGLPPGPIANPGRAAIEATLNPEKHDYLYFVANGTGGHAFAKTLQEHNQNVAQWRKIRRAQ